ncbi:MAG: DUF5640 domain-containing protein [Candidatus Pelethousia sp.]|nr:DUF5640 domain-containing protein [Candidatus Pelethousia sp.]
MTCKKCGSENDDHEKICQKCGANLDHAPKPSKKRPRTYLIAALVAVGVIAVTITLVLLLGNGRSLTGPWHNEGLGQLLRFHEDETVVIRTPHGDFEAAYVFDQEDGRGVIIFNEEAISFTIEGEELLLTWSGVQTTFVRGEMEVVAAIAEATPAVTAPTTITPSLEVTPEASTSVPLPSASPTATSSAAPTTAPSAAPTTAPSAVPSASPTPTPLPSSLGPFFTPLPQISAKPVIPGDIIGNLSIPIVGVWINPDDSEYTLTFDDNGKYVLTTSGSDMSGDYTYDKATGKGDLDWLLGMRFGFTVSGNTLTLQDGSTYERK